MANRKITGAQAQRMKDALGLKPYLINAGEHVHPPRNIWTCPAKTPDEDFQSLVNRGFATVGRLPGYPGRLVYRVTEKGRKYLSGILKITILNH